MLFKYLNPHVIAIATETEGRETCQLEICMLTDTHSLMHVLYSYPILRQLYIIDTMSNQDSQTLTVYCYHTN